MPIQNLVGTVLHHPLQSIAYTINRELSAAFADHAVLETTDGDFNLPQYVADGHCRTTINPLMHPQLEHSWNGLEWGGIYKQIKNAWIDVSWNDESLRVLSVTWSENGCESQYHWIVAPTLERAEAFFTAVCTWNSEIRDEILVFEEGHWDKNKELFQAIKSATFESLVLRGSLKQDILLDLTTFFASAETYQTYGVPWKRGILLIGPPGNGKTHTVKALINALGKPCLYVKSFEAQYSTASHNIQHVFERARRAAPCVLILEDLDALITDQSRSFFLNEVDGFAANNGIVLLATTNHPERIDAAILNRPSRFDRKYHFDLPALAERQAYIQRWNSSLQAVTQLSRQGVETAAEATVDFSFAYLKELFLSALMAWVATPHSGAMDTVLIQQITLLREQMISA